VHVTKAYRYRAERWLATWAEWVMDVCHDRSTPAARVRALAAKHWQRALVGRSAMRYKDWSEVGTAYVPGVSYMPLLDLDTGKQGACLTLGERRYEAWSEAWWDHALPQLLSAVMAHTRCRLWAAMVTAGLDHVAYTHTDMLIVDAEGDRRLLEACERRALWSLRRKGSYRTHHIWGPGMLDGSSYRRLAGVPKKASHLGSGEYLGETWESVTTSLAEGHPSEVRVAPRRQQLHYLDHDRRHLPGGATEPYRVVDGARAEAAEVAG